MNHTSTKDQAISAAYNLSNILDALAREIQPCDPAFVADLHKLTHDAAKIGRAIDLIHTRYENRA